MFVFHAQKFSCNKYLQLGKDFMLTLYLKYKIYSLAQLSFRQLSEMFFFLGGGRGGGKNRRHTRLTKPRENLNQPTRPPIWTMFRDLRSKPQLHAKSK